MNKRFCHICVLCGKGILWGTGMYEEGRGHAHARCSIKKYRRKYNLNDRHIKLKPCPYCGKKVDLDFNDYTKEYSVTCECFESDKVTSPGCLDRQNVINSWNGKHRPICKNHSWEVGRCGIVYCTICHRHPLEKHKVITYGFATE